jgi:hypothetical protein
MFLLTSGLLPALAQRAGGSRTPVPGNKVEARKEFESSGAAQRRVPCDEVISRVDHYAEVQPGNVADVSKVAKELGTNVTWVERCMLAYGRRAKRSRVESAETTAQRLESFEEDEPEEVGPEDVEEEGSSARRGPSERQRRLHQVIRQRSQGNQERSE